MFAFLNSITLALYAIISINAFDWLTENDLIDRLDQLWGISLRPSIFFKWKSIGGYTLLLTLEYAHILIFAHVIMYPVWRHGHAPPSCSGLYVIQFSLVLLRESNRNDSFWLKTETVIFSSPSMVFLGFILKRHYSTIFHFTNTKK